MAKKNNVLDVDNLKVNFKIQNIGVLIGFGIAIGVNVATFNNMKSQLEHLTQITEDLDDEIINQFNLQNADFGNKMLEIQKSQSKMEGQLEMLING